jgi:aminoglycoside 6-adenylyltransferase
MRSEREMLKLILDTAKNDERIRAVILEGSRANPNVRRDIFQDFDIAYLVTDVASFTSDHSWIDIFGARMILQMPDAMNDQPPANGQFAYLMQFIDGHRLDLTLLPVARLREMARDSLSVLLLDKDGIVEPFPLPSESDYLPRPPTAKQFANCCNEFWWMCPYVAKGLWREQIVYAKHAFDHGVRPELARMLTWYVGVKTRFLCNPGGFGKHLKRYLEPELWRMLESTYADADYQRNWDALFATGELFRITANAVAGHFDFAYPHGDDEKVSAHLRHVRSLPRDAKEMYPYKTGHKRQNQRPIELALTTRIGIKRL